MSSYNKLKNSLKSIDNSRGSASNKLMKKWEIMETIEASFTFNHIFRVNGNIVEVYYNDFLNTIDKILVNHPSASTYTNIDECGNETLIVELNYNSLHIKLYIRENLDMYFFQNKKQNIHNFGLYLEVNGELCNIDDIIKFINIIE